MATVLSQKSLNKAQILQNDDYSQKEQKGLTIDGTGTNSTMKRQVINKIMQNK